MEEARPSREEKKKTDGRVELEWHEGINTYSSGKEVSFVRVIVSVISAAAGRRNDWAAMAWRTTPIQETRRLQQY